MPSRNLVKRMAVTEKGARLRAARQYVFEVSKDATKNEIKKEIGRLFKVHPISVNTIVRAGGSKRAIVLVKEGETIAEADVAKVYEKKASRAGKKREASSSGAKGAKAAPEPAESKK